MSFLKIRASLFLAMVFFLIMCKQTKSIVQEELAEEKLENALLWEISGKTLARSSYLFGTIHIIREEDYFLPEGTLEALNNTEKIVFEINMEEIEDISNLLSFLSGIMMKDGISLKDLVTEEEYKLIKDHFDDIGIPLFFFERMKPMFLTVFTSGDVKPGDIENGAIKSYETELLHIGKESKKEFGGLETIEFQISLFDSIPYKDQANMLVESIRAADTEGDQFKEMVKIYKAQDLNAMQEMFSFEEGGFERFEDILLVNRNRSWIPKMEAIMNNKTTFFAVGAGHLGGKYGVINLLRDAGYKLRPISNIP